MLKHGFYNVLGAGIRIVTNILTIPILIRLVGVEEYGLWTIISTIVNLVSLAEAGLSVSTTFFLSRELKNDDSKKISEVITVTLGGMLILSTIAGFALFLWAVPFASFFSKLTDQQQLQAVKAIRFSALVVWSRLLQQVCIGIEQALQKYGVMNFFITLQALVVNIGILIIAQMGGKSLGFMQLQAVAGLLLLVLHLLTIKNLLRRLDLRPYWNAKMAVEILNYSLQTWVASLGSAIFANVDRIIVGSILNTQILGVYAAITNITTQINTFSSLPIQPLIPLLSSYCTNEDKKNSTHLKEEIRQASILNISIAFFLGGVLVNFAFFILKTVISNQYHNEYTFYFRIAAIIYSIYSINAVGYFTLFGLGFAKINMIGVALSGSTSILLIYFLTLKFGLLGSIIGNSGYILTVSLTFYALKNINFSFLEVVKLLAFPMAWLSLSTFVISFKNQSLLITIVLTIFESSCMGIWFYKNYNLRSKLLLF